MLQRKRMTRGQKRALLGLLFLVALGSSPARADIYSYIDQDGVVHYTNIPRPGRKWKRIMRTGPGKAGSVHARRRSRSLSPRRYHEYSAHISQAAALYHIPRR